MSNQGAQVNYTYKTHESATSVNATYEVFSGDQSLGFTYRIGNQWFSAVAGEERVGPFKTRALSAASLGESTPTVPELNPVSSVYLPSALPSPATSQRLTSATTRKPTLVSRVKGFFARA